MPLFSFPNLIVVFVAALAALVLLFSRALAHSSAWRATTTPLASIMGSGFLVCAPLLYAHVGNSAVLAMGVLLFIAYGIGSVIRFNIRYAEPLFDTASAAETASTENHPLHNAHCQTAGCVAGNRTLQTLETLSHFVLAGAYCVSVSYYLQLLAHFSLHHFPWRGTVIENGIVTAILLGIGTIGILRGLKGIERVERFVVGLNLALILSLIAGLIYFNSTALIDGDWSVQPLPVDEDTGHLARILMGLLIVVQGFETSRFLGSEHSAEERIRTMRWAQIISSLIYLVFVALMALVMGHTDPSAAPAGVTAIITLSAIVAPVLPLMITLTAVGSQFSAATADDAGCAGLIQSFLKRRKGLRWEYAFVSTVSIALTWLTDTFEIINIASRAFALYYMIQCLVALVVVQQTQNMKARYMRCGMFACLALLCMAVVIWGIPAG